MRLWIATAAFIFIGTAAQAMSNDRALITQILIEKCSYNTDCGFDPALHPPPRKPV